MSIDTTNIPEQIRALKRQVREQCPDVNERFREVEALVAEEVANIEAATQRGESVIPETAFSDIAENRVSNEAIKAVKRRGAVVVRGCVKNECRQARDDQNEAAGLCGAHGSPLVGALWGTHGFPSPFKKIEKTKL